MFQVILFDSLLFGSTAYALWQGDQDSRLVALICLIASLLSLVAVHPMSARYAGVELGVMAVDGATLLGMMVVALNSSRFWPLWVTGLQLTTLLAHLSKQIDISLVPTAYAVAAVFWSYPILVILAVATWRGHRRRLSKGADWPAAL